MSNTPACPAPSIDTHGPDFPDVPWDDYQSGRLRFVEDGRFVHFYRWSPRDWRRTPVRLRPSPEMVDGDPASGVSVTLPSRAARPTDSYLVEAPDGDGLWLVVEPGRPIRPLFQVPDMLRRDMKVWDRACGDHADRRRIRKGVVR